MVGRQHHLGQRAAGKSAARGAVLTPAETFEDARLERERKTVAAMIATYCRGHHAGSRDLCAECAELEAYTRVRLERCPYGETKPTCVHCPIHCYQPHRREQIRVVMAYAGPRMLWRHPILAVRHMLDGRRKAPPLRASAPGPRR